NIHIILSIILLFCWGSCRNNKSTLYISHFYRKDNKVIFIYSYRGQFGNKLLSFYKKGKNVLNKLKISNSIVGTIGYSNDSILLYSLRSVDINNIDSNMTFISVSSERNNIKVVEYSINYSSSILVRDINADSIFFIKDSLYCYEKNK